MNSSFLNSRPATKADYPALATLLNLNHNVHRHLDWRYSLDWLGYQPFWVLEANNQIIAALACPPDPPHVAWIRLFFTAHQIETTTAWKLLYKQVRASLQGRTDIQFAAVALQPWFNHLLQQNGFQIFQNIVILEWENTPIQQKPVPTGLVIRPIQAKDLPAIAEVDANSFQALWINTLDSINLSLNQSAYATLAEFQGKVIGFQISTSNPFSAHLARLAILPEFQGMGFGYALLQDLMLYFQSRMIWQITVNTQDSNSSSLKLYQKIGFRLTGEQFPVLVDSL